MSSSTVYDQLVDHLNSMPIGATCSTESITLVARPEEEQQPILPTMELVSKVMSDKKREFKF
jgi:hypothetical protein